MAQTSELLNRWGCGGEGGYCDFLADMPTCGINCHLCVTGVPGRIIASPGLSRGCFDTITWTPTRFLYVSAGTPPPLPTACLPPEVQSPRWLLFSSSTDEGAALGKGAE